MAGHENRRRQRALDMEKAAARVLAEGGTQAEADAAKAALYQASHTHNRATSMTLRGFSVRANTIMDESGRAIGSGIGALSGLVMPLFPPAGIVLGITGAGFTAHSKLLEGYAESLEMKQAWQRAILRANGNLQEATRIMIEEGYLPPGEEGVPDPHPQLAGKAPAKVSPKFKQLAGGSALVAGSTFI